MGLVCGFLMALITWCCGQIATAPTSASKTEACVYPSPFARRLAEAALSLTKDRVRYDPAYFVIPYPNGDVPADRGVCTDVVIRAYRKVDIDLQKAVHEDMKTHFGLYPKKWALSKPDPNIDHRRVPNLQVFFARKGAVLPISQRSADYVPGDVVTWDLGHGLTHIGVVVCHNNNVPTIVHNIGNGQVSEDVLFHWPITGHYRYAP